MSVPAAIYVIDFFGVLGAASLGSTVICRRLMRPKKPKGECKNCLHYRPDDSMKMVGEWAVHRYAKCAASKHDYLCMTERLPDTRGACGTYARKFRPKEQDDNGHRDTPEAASSGAGQATNPSPGAATASAGSAGTASGYAVTGSSLMFSSPVAAVSAALAIRTGPPPGTWRTYSKLALEPLPKPKIEEAGITVGEIIAWRAWRVQYGFIMSAYVNEAWAPDAVMEGDVAEGLGVHAWKSSHKALGYLFGFAGDGNHHAMVIGKVALWGEIIEHKRGYRAQYAKPVSFDFVVTNGHSNVADEELLLTELRKRYKIEAESE